MNELKTGGLDVVGNCDLISEGFRRSPLRCGDAGQPDAFGNALPPAGGAGHAAP